MSTPRNYTPKELSAFLAENGVSLSEQTIRNRCHLWEQNPRHVLAIPYLRQLGRPFRIPREVAEGLVRTVEAVA